MNTMSGTLVENPAGSLSQEFETSGSHADGAVMPNSKTKVLVIDDEPEIVEEIAELLAGAGFPCGIAGDPREALDAFRADGDISIIVTDLKMPGMDGLAMVRTLQEDLPAGRDVAVIVITGHGETDDAIEALRLGAVDFLTKPVAPEHLVHVVERAAETLRLRDLERQFRERLERKVEERTAEVRELSDDLSRANRNLETRNRELAVVNRVKSEFLALISHELRTPLNAVIGFSEIMERNSEEKGETKELEYHRIISESGRNLLRIVNTILELADAQVGEQPLDKVDVDPSDLIDRVVEVLKPKAREAGVEIIIDLKNTPKTVFADQHGLTQAVGNILDNAIQFSPADTEICINVESEDGELSISIADNGMGMSEEEIPIAGEAFRQVDGGLSRKVDGLGLGLTLSRMYVELHGGKLKVDSSPGLGTTVRMTIPHGGR